MGAPPTPTSLRPPPVRPCAGGAWHGEASSGSLTGGVRSSSCAARSIRSAQRRTTCPRRPREPERVRIDVPNQSYNVLGKTNARADPERLGRCADVTPSGTSCLAALRRSVSVPESLDKRSVGPAAVENRGAQAGSQLTWEEPSCHRTSIRSEAHRPAFRPPNWRRSCSRSFRRPSCDHAGPEWAHRLPPHRRRSGTSALSTVNPDGGHERQITFPSAATLTRWGNWSPDGTKLFSTGHECGPDCGTDELYIVNADGSNPHKIPTPEPSIESPAWSPDGQRSPSSWRQVGWSRSRCGSPHLAVGVDDEFGFASPGSTVDAGVIIATWNPMGLVTRADRLACMPGF